MEHSKIGSDYREREDMAIITVYMLFFVIVDEFRFIMCVMISLLLVSIH